MKMRVIGTWLLAWTDGVCSDYSASLAWEGAAAQRRSFFIARDGVTTLLGHFSPPPPPAPLSVTAQAPV